MIPVIGTYSFLPWLRRGLANTVQAPAAGATRATVAVSLTLTGDQPGGGTQTRTVQRDVELYGPGDLKGLHDSAVIRREPRIGTTNFEPNYLAFIEFYDEDLPWRYTPAPPSGSHRLTPWLTLVVLSEDEFDDGAAPGKPLPFVEVGDTGGFPAADELWAWAHVHVNRGLDTAGEIVSDDVTQVLTRFDAEVGANPDLGISRLVCPRKLLPDTPYQAFVVPTYETGRLAVLGLDPGGSPGALHPAWEPYADRAEPTRYGYYHRWSFRTGTVGDFESLVRLLRPRPVDPHVGQRDMDVQSPLPTLPGITDPALMGVLRLGGALKVPDADLDPAELAQAQKYETWDTPYPHPFQTALADLVGLAESYRTGSAGEPDPVITPPLYGQWHALTNRLLELTVPPSDHNWVNRLNLDPRFRVAAGFGTAVVQDNQEEYMAAAWNQIGEVLEANRRIRLGHLAREVSGSLHRRHLAAQLASDPARVLALTAPVHPRVLRAGTTVSFGAARSLLAVGPLGVAMRRALRPAGRLVRAVGDPASGRRLLADLAVGKATAAPPKRPPSGVVTTEPLAHRLEKFRDRVPWLLLNDDTRDPTLVERLPKVPDYRLLQFGPDAPQFDKGERDSADAARFKAGASANAEIFRASAEAGAEAPRPAFDVVGVADHVLTQIHPDLTVPRRVLAGLHLPERLRDRVLEEFREVMAYPEIDVPMYRPLVDRSSELFLPNLNLIEPNSITVLETNRRFIESYLVGLNHEFARELLWREYPTDQQGSYFRQFWDPRTQLALPGETAAARRERLRDVPPLHVWPTVSILGTHNNRATVPGSDQEDVVLVIRGELLKRYPTAVIYAQRAVWPRKGDGTIDLGAERELDELLPAEAADPPRTKLRLPMYDAKVDPDIYFFGFDLTAKEVLGDEPTAPDPDPGWFFVIRERPGEPRFGLDISREGALNVWNDLAWDDVAPAPAARIPVGAGAPVLNLAEPVDPSLEEKVEQWGDDRALHWGPDLNASEIAYILYQAPVLVAVHAQEMLRSD